MLPKSYSSNIFKTPSTLYFTLTLTFVDPIFGEIGVNINFKSFNTFGILYVYEGLRLDNCVLIK